MSVTAPVLRIDQDVVGIDVLVDDSAVVQPLEHLGELSADPREGGEVHPALRESGS